MIFEYAFTPMAATGGFAGSTVMLAIRWAWPAAYSNEAGTRHGAAGPIPPLPPTIR
ncbi:MAG: hypothetical protein ACLTG0_08550 [Oscillibacter sp.]